MFRTNYIDSQSDTKCAICEEAYSTDSPKGRLITHIGASNSSCCAHISCVIEKLKAAPDSCFNCKFPVNPNSVEGYKESLKRNSYQKLEQMGQVPNEPTRQGSFDAADSSSTTTDDEAEAVLREQVEVEGHEDPQVKADAELARKLYEEEGGRLEVPEDRANSNYKPTQAEIDEAHTLEFLAGEKKQVQAPANSNLTPDDEEKLTRDFLAQEAQRTQQEEDEELQQVRELEAQLNREEVHIPVVVVPVIAVANVVQRARAFAASLPPVTRAVKAVWLAVVIVAIARFAMSYK